MTNLSEHFTVEEFEYSDTARALGINNKMNEIQLKEAKHTCTYLLEPIRKLLNDTYKTYNNKKVKCVSMKITSGFRCISLNRKLNSKDNSQHVKAQASDIEATIVCTDGTKKTLPYTELYTVIKNAVKNGKITIDQCIQEHSSKATWVHVSLADQLKNCRKQFLKYDGKTYKLDK